MRIPSGRHTGWSQSLGLPQFEHLEEMAAVMERFWGAVGRRCAARIKQTGRRRLPVCFILSETESGARDRHRRE